MEVYLSTWLIWLQSRRNLGGASFTSVFAIDIGSSLVLHLYYFYLFIHHVNLSTCIVFASDFIPMLHAADDNASNWT